MHRLKKSVPAFSASGSGRRILRRDEKNRGAAMLCEIRKAPPFIRLAFEPPDRESGRKRREFSRRGAFFEFLLKIGKTFYIINLYVFLNYSSVYSTKRREFL